MPPVSAWREVLVGLAIGYAAKYGLLISEGETPSFRAFLGDLLLAGLVALFGMLAVQKLELHGYPACFLISMFALSSNHVARIIRGRFVRWLDRQVAMATGQVRSEAQLEISKERLEEDQRRGALPKVILDKLARLDAFERKSRSDSARDETKGP